MNPADAYLARLQATIASLRYWVPTVADVVRHEEFDSPDYWKLAITPNIATACPLELLLRADEHYDISVAGEYYEDLPIHSLDMLVPLVEAIAMGHVVQRVTTSARTGVKQRVETVVTLGNGEIWRQHRELTPPSPHTEPDEMLVTVRHFLPYRR